MPRPKTSPGAIGHNSGGAVDRAKLKEFVDRIEALAEERDQISEDIKSITPRPRPMGSIAKRCAPSSP